MTERDRFEAWFVGRYGPLPSDEDLASDLAAAARLQAFMGGAWAAWQYLVPFTANLDPLSMTE